VLEDGDLTIRLKGSYDPGKGNWSVSAKSSAIVYTLTGKAGAAGSTSATIAVKNSDSDEWVPYFFPVTETAVSIPGAAGAVESDTGGIPSWAQGYWHSSKTYENGHTESMVVLLGQWGAKVGGTKTDSHGYTSPINIEQTVISVTGPDGSGSYEYIACYPEYVLTGEATENLYIKAIAGCLEISVNDIKVLDAIPTDTEWWATYWQNPYKWVVFNKDESDFDVMFGFSDVDWEKLDMFWNAKGWERWAMAHPEEVTVTKVIRYMKAKQSYTNGNNTFIMTPMATADGTREFDSLAALNAATLIEMPDHAMTFNR
jgi:hypothetical protein